MERDLKNKNVLVTGGAGFIGSHLIDALFYEGVQKIIIIDNMFLGDERNIKNAIEKGAILYKDDAEIYTSLEYILKENDIDIVFNCATKALNYSFVNPSNAYMTNVNIMNNLLELLRKKAYSTLCHFSTSEVYGTAIYEPMDEGHPMNPTTTYAAGKAAADLMLQSYVNMFGVDAFTVRPFNNYGPRQNSKGKLAGIIPITISRILQNKPPIVHGDGEQKRDFIYVEDTIKAILKLFPVMEIGECVNISANGVISMKELVEKICNVMEYDGDILYKERRTADVNCHNSSNAKLLKKVNIEFVKIDEGIKNTRKWYEDELCVKEMKK